MKNLKIFIVLALFTLFDCAAPLNLNSEFDESIDFDSYATFVLCVDDLFVENPSYPRYDNIEVRSLIGGEIENQMILKGYETNVSKPELQAGFRILLSQEEVIFTNCDLQTEYGYWKSCTINKEVYTRETLVLYVSDIDKNQVVWQAKMDCDLNKSLKSLKPYVKELVARAYSEFPK